MIIIDAKNPQISMVGTITSTGPGWAVVRSDSGRSVKAESSLIWGNGQRVGVVSGQITGLAGSAPVINIHEV